jgi:predicted amino acid-binding ACT domain protein
VAAGPANLAINFTEKLKEFYQRNTRLALINDNGDISLEGTIVKYTVEPVAPTAGSGDLQQIAGQQRLTIGIKVQYMNTKDGTKDFEQEFSQYTDFGANVNISQVEATLIEEIFNRIVLDIFNKSAGDW